MTLREWAATPGEVLLDVECWTLARAINPVERKVSGFVVFSAPLPYRVLLFDTLEDVATWMKRPLEEIVGTPYSDTDWARTTSGVC